MIKRHASAAASPEPRRALHANFTARTLRHAAIAKRRAIRKQQLLAFIKEPFSMQSLKFLRTAPGAALALAIIASASVGTYALTNWFNGDVTVKQDASVLSVDLSQCKTNLPGFEVDADKHDVQFKVLGDPHISAASLQEQLLIGCERDAVAEFYRTSGHAYNLYSSTVKVVKADSITLDYYLLGGALKQKAFTFSKDATFYDKGKSVTVQDVKVGDTVIFAVQPPANWQEGADPLQDVHEVASIFKTQYNTKNAPGKAFYEQNNIMPLDMYEQLHK